VVVGHILGQRHERWHAYLQNLIQQAEVKGEQIAIDRMQ
jgi:hypothetical protein